MNELTREEAIKRIKDIKSSVITDHITNKGFDGDYLCTDCERGAINELMAIFDIKEEEL